MRRYRYTTTDCFQVGEEVYVTGIKCRPSGRIKYSVRPTKCKIIGVSRNSIEIESRGISYAPTTYILDHPGSLERDTSLNLNIAKTKEEAVENYNQRIFEEIEYYYNSFKDTETRLKWYLL